MDWRRLRFPTAGEISPSRFRPDRLLHTTNTKQQPKKEQNCLKNYNNHNN